MDHSSQPTEELVQALDALRRDGKDVRPVPDRMGYYFYGGYVTTIDKIMEMTRSK